MSDASTTVIVAVLSSGALAAIMGALINGAFTKKKLGAEATEIITNAASGVVTRLEDELKRQRDDMAAMRRDHADALVKQATEHASEREDWRRVLQLHVAWDYIAIEKMSHVGIELPPPPPILPPIDPRK